MQTPFGVSRSAGSPAMRVLAAAAINSQPLFMAEPTKKFSQDLKKNDHELQTETHNKHKPQKKLYPSGWCCFFQTKNVQHIT